MFVLVASLGGWGVVGIATANAAPDLALSTAGGGDFIVGQEAVFVLTVTNVSGGTTSGTTTVADTLPSSMTLDYVNAPGWTCAGQQTVICTTTAAVPSGSSFPTVDLYVVPTAAAVPIATNHAGLALAGDPVATNNTSDLAVVVAYAADMSIGLSHVGGPLKSGGAETINIRVHNEGYYRVDGTTIVSSAVPAGLTVTSVSGGTTWTCTTAQAFTCTTASDGGSTGNYTNIRLGVKATDAGYPTAAVTATVVNTPDQNPANNAATDTIFVVATHDAAAEIAPPPVLTVGKTGQFTFRARNLGSAALAGATLSLALPPQLRFVSVVGAGWSCTPGVPVTSCVDARVITGTDTLIIKARALRPIVGVAVTATVASIGDQNPANNTVAAPLAINPYVPRAFSVTGQSGQRRTGVIHVGDRLTVRLPTPRRGARWHLHTASTALTRPYIQRSQGFTTMKFAARHAGRATLRFTRKASRHRSRRYVLILTVADSGA